MRGVGLWCVLCSSLGSHCVPCCHFISADSLAQHLLLTLGGGQGQVMVTGEGLHRQRVVFCVVLEEGVSVWMREEIRLYRLLMQGALCSTNRSPDKRTQNGLDMPIVTMLLHPWSPTSYLCVLCYLAITFFCADCVCMLLLVVFHFCLKHCRQLKYSFLIILHQILLNLLRNMSERTE